MFWDNRFVNEFKNCTRNEGFIDLPKEIIERRLEFLSVIDELIHHKLTVAEVNIPPLKKRGLPASPKTALFPHMGHSVLHPLHRRYFPYDLR